ncbi:type II secretion system minor pseudopilin GspK [Methylobacter sp.]|uniref:type II secretion system minor pseudopilin GspK n=1 Tax=Methylobacter sp. TaxID=2051955 RepID=UPI00121E869B|nr:type II secretion system minor pseudopilin GspK [Methylobacter sp.]TAK65331.1 MAG: general secretion pathway protein GspK [Methylobacter sp.]
MTSTGYRQPTSERGIALITVMLVLAVVTVALVSMSSNRQMDIRRTENQLRAIQAWEYVYGLEAWAEGRLRDDFADNKNDALTDLWSKPLSTPIPEGSFDADITELQGRINLNNLLVDGAASDDDVQRLKRLFSNLDIKPELVDAMLDWIDADMDIRYPHGAEDETYTKSPQPYRSANSLFSDVSELLRVQGFTLKDYEKLLPYIYVAESYEPLNVNTASAVVLRAMVGDIKKDQAESIFRASGKPFEKVEDFLKDEAMAGISVNKTSLGVTSNHFLLSGQIDMGKNGLAFRSLLKRNKDGVVTVVRRMRRSSIDG